MRYLVPLLVWLLAYLPGVLAAGEEADYLVGSGDTIKIQVFGEDDLSLEIHIGDAGTISYPFLGEIEASGKSVREIERTILDGLLGRYLLDPKVNVTVTTYRSFFVNGEVARPGGYAFVPGLTVRKAIALAGGFAERASRNKIFVTRGGAALPERNEPVALDDPILPDDTITVEQSFF